MATEASAINLFELSKLSYRDWQPSMTMITANPVIAFLLSLRLASKAPPHAAYEGF